MTSSRIKRNIIRAAVYAGVALSIYSVKAGSALAWGSWGSYVWAGNEGDCHTPSYGGIGYIYSECFGHSYASGTTLTAYNVADGAGYNKTEAQAESQSPTVIAYGNPNNVYADTTASTNVPSNIGRHRCRCEGTWFPL